MNWFIPLDPGSAGCALFLRAAMHFLWQGALIAGVVWAGEPLMGRLSAGVRYRVLLAVLMVMAACPFVTFWITGDRASAAAYATSGGVGEGEFDSTGISARDSSGAVIVQTPSAGTIGRSIPISAAPASSPFTRIAPWVVGAYVFGVVLMLIRLAVAAVAAKSLCRGAAEVDESFRERARRVAARLRMRTVPPVMFCVRVATPAVIGVVRPIVLMPVSIMTELSAAQLEAILAHELAHIRRHDHLVNLIQRLIESFLFFHPAVWFVSNRIRAERENCCDDVAMSMGASPAEYADGLVKVAVFARERTSLFALGAADRRSRLGRRVMRILGEERTGHPIFPGGLAVVVASLIAIAALSAQARLITRIRTDAPATNVAATRPAAIHATTVNVGETDAGYSIEWVLNDSLVVTMAEETGVSRWVRRGATNSKVRLVGEKTTVSKDGKSQTRDLTFVASGNAAEDLTFDLIRLPMNENAPYVEAPTEATIAAEGDRREKLMRAQAPKNSATGELLFPAAMTEEISRMRIGLPTLMKAKAQEDNRKHFSRVVRTVVIHVLGGRADGVNRGLEWLAGKVGKDGAVAGEKAPALDFAMSSLTGLALLASGSTPGEGPYGVQLAAIVDRLLARQKPSGLLADGNTQMYEHGYSTLFLAETYMKRRDERVAASIGKAVAVIEAAANNEGGWRYSTQPLDADVSVTACELNALLAAKAAGIAVKPEVIERGLAYVRRCKNADGGFSYMAGQGGFGGSGWPRSAAAVAVLIHGGVRLADDDVVKGIRYVTDALRLGSKPHYSYGIYYTSQWIGSAARDADATAAMTNGLMGEQKDDGSWDGEISPTYATASALIALQAGQQRLWMFR